MNSQTKNCQNCKKDFVIEPDDFDFYEKIKVPPPTFCPECRLQRRFSFRNERSLYHRKCDLCKQGIIARYSSDVEFPVYCLSCWNSDKWNPIDFGQAYDFGKPFFVQFRELSHHVPRPALYSIRMVNSEYANQCIDSKNVYLSMSVVESEDIYFSYAVDLSKSVFDVAYAKQLERCYEIINGESCNNVSFSQHVKNIIDSTFLYDVRGSTHCFLCVNLRNIKYAILNKKYTKDEYERKRTEYSLGSYRILKEAQDKFRIFSSRFPKRFATLSQSIDVTGDNLMNSKNTQYSFDSDGIENCKYVVRISHGGKDSYDVNHSKDPQFCYECWSTNGNNQKFCNSAFGQRMTYCEFCSANANADCFGCISFHAPKKYCILNKQYSKEEYETLVFKIIEHMKAMPYTDKRGKVYPYGEFFPPEFSPFAYNETIAQEYFPLIKEEAVKKGFLWKDHEIKNYTITIKATDLPDHIKEVNDDITKETIGCFHGDKCNEQCTTAFRIIPEELAFYKQTNLALPRLCPNCRHYDRLKQRNPLKLWHRKCMCDYIKFANVSKHAHHPEGQCPNEFETTYAPERPEIVYCEACYNAEVA